MEKVIQEHTPLTSIKESDALAEHLRSLNVRTNMVMEELRRVTQERDNYKKKTEEEDEELASLKQKLAVVDAVSPEKQDTKSSEAASAPQHSEVANKGLQAEIGKLEVVVSDL